MPTLTEKKETRKLSGLVVSYFGSSVAVEAEDGQVFQCHLRRNQTLPVVGDNVIWQLETGNTGIIHEILPRKSLLSRGDGHDKVKPIAANIDIILLAMSPPPILSPYLLDRYLVAAELLNIQPVIVLNKSDLLSSETNQEAHEILDPYEKIGYAVVYTTVMKEDGLDSLKNILKGKSAVLVGPSGVGKSSIIAKLNIKDTIRIGDVSPKGAGKHTTTATRLYHLPDGGSLIDSPGVREFNLWPTTKAEIFRGFRELNTYATGCKFRDCSHTVEPGCAVQKAVEEGKINAGRFAHFLELTKKSKNNDKKS